MKGKISEILSLYLGNLNKKTTNFMRKTLIPLLSMLLIVMALFTACNKKADVIATPTLEQKLAKDVVLSNAIEAAKELYLKTSGGTLNDPNSITALKSIVEKINNKTATTADYTKAEAILGMSYDGFIKELQTFGIALAKVNEKYPEYRFLFLDSEMLAKVSLIISKAFMYVTGLLLGVFPMGF